MADPSDARPLAPRLSFFLRPHNEEGWDLAATRYRERAWQGKRNERPFTIATVPCMRWYTLPPPLPTGVLYRRRGDASDRIRRVRVHRCGAGYADGIPEQAVFDKYYREMSKYEYAQREGAESDYDRRRLEIIADIIAPHVASPDARVLDIGCASGRLLANLARSWVRQCAGVGSVTCVRSDGRAALRHRRASDDAGRRR